MEDKDRRIQELEKELEEIKDQFRRSGIFTISFPTLSKPTLEQIRARANSPGITVTEIDRDESRTDAFTLVIGPIFPDLQGRVNLSGEMFNRTVEIIGRAKLGWQHGIWILEHQNDHDLFLIKNLVKKTGFDLTGIGVRVEKYFPSFYGHLFVDNNDGRLDIGLMMNAGVMA